MLTGKNLLNELVDELNELKLSHMAAKLDSLYHAPGFLELDHMTLLAELIGDEYREKLSKTLTNRLRTTILHYRLIINRLSYRFSLQYTLPSQPPLREGLPFLLCKIAFPI